MVNSSTISVLIYGSSLKRSTDLSQLLIEEPALNVVGAFDYVDRLEQSTQISEANIILVDPEHLLKVSELIQNMSLSKTIVFTASGAINFAKTVKSNHNMAKLLHNPNFSEHKTLGNQQNLDSINKTVKKPENDKKIYLELLTEREQEVLDYLVKGCSYKMIAYSMFISIDTVRSHIKKIYTKLEVNSKSEAVIKVLKSE